MCKLSGRRLFFRLLKIFRSPSRRPCLPGSGKPLLMALYLKFPPFRRLPETSSFRGRRLFFRLLKSSAIRAAALSSRFGKTSINSILFEVATSPQASRNFKFSGGGGSFFGYLNLPQSEPPPCLPGSEKPRLTAFYLKLPPLRKLPEISSFRGAAALFSVT